MSEPPPRLSVSSIWQRSRAFYDAQGADAWLTEGLPTRICNNAGLAAAYASLVRSVLEDCGADAVQIVELGGGTGAFAHLFLCEWDDLAARRGAPVPAVRYLLTDAFDATVAFWAGHPRLAAHARSGRLRTARVDVLAPLPDDLLAGAPSTTPVVLIANYVLDSLPCDVFRARGGHLEEGAPVLDADPVRFEYTLAPAAPYGDASLDAICAGYAARFEHTSFTFPIAAIQALRRLRELTDGPCLVIAADKGYGSEDELAPIKVPALIRHGDACSMSVNFDALARDTVAGGGAALCTTGRLADLQVAALALRPPPRLDRLRATFAEQLDRAGPIDAFQVVEHALAGDVTLDLAISLLHLARAEPHVVLMIADRLRPLLGAATPPQRRCLAALLQRARALHYPLRGACDVAFEIGVLLGALDRPALALDALADSVAFFGATPSTCFAAAMSHLMLDQPSDALGLLDQALALDPGYAPARQWRDHAADQVQRSR